jgi:hypothetical protein
MPPLPSGFGTALLGQTEKALTAILARELTGTGVTEPQWVALVLTIAAADDADADAHAAGVAHALRVPPAQARARLDELAAAGMITLEGTAVAPTDAGRALHTRVRAATAPITERLWGDLHAADLEVAGRVLRTVLDRADAELAAGDR